MSYRAWARGSPVGYLLVVICAQSEESRGVRSLCQATAYEMSSRFEEEQDDIDTTCRSASVIRLGCMTVHVHRIRVRAMSCIYLPEVERHPAGSLTPTCSSQGCAMSPDGLAYMYIITR